MLSTHVNQRATWVRRAGSYLLVIYHGRSEAYNSGMITALTNRILFTFSSHGSSDSSLIIFASIYNSKLGSSTSVLL